GKKVKVSYLRKELRCGYGDSRVVRVAAIPYEDRRFTMLILLPYERGDLEDLEKSLTTDNFTKWTSKLREQRLELKVPKFRFESEFSLKDTLSQLGASSVFGVDTADLTGICAEDAGVFLSDVRQRTFIEVNENGTEAAAATATGGFFGGMRRSDPNRVIP